MKIQSHRRRTAVPAPPAELTETFRARIEPILRNPTQYGLTHCLTCPAPLTQIGIFFPTPSFAVCLGTPAGKKRALVYGLCDQCLQSPDWMKHVEASFLAGDPRRTIHMKERL
jgi:hypothetical protein